MAVPSAPALDTETDKCQQQSNLKPMDNNNERSNNDLENAIQVRTPSDARAKIRHLLGKILKISITDGRVIVGSFVCTDREGNVILENSWEYDKSIETSEEPRLLGLALVPGKHIVSVAVMM